MALASLFDPKRIDLCFLDGGFPVAHVHSTGGGWYATQAQSGWDHLGGAFITPPAMVASKAQPQLVNAPQDLSAPSDVPTPPHVGAPPEVRTALHARPSRAQRSAPRDPAAAPAAQAVAAVAKSGPLGGAGAGAFEPKTRLDVFAVGTDSAMHHQVLWQGTLATTPAWANLGGIFISAPTPATAFGDERIDLFGLGTDRAMYHKIWNGAAWTPVWERLGGIFSSDASAVSWAPGQLDLFVRGADFSLRHRAYNGTVWLNDWQNIGGSLASAPAAISWGPNRLDVFAVSHEGSLIHTWWDGMIWNAWEDLGTPHPDQIYIATPSAVSWGPNRMDVLVIGGDSNLYHYWFADRSWNGPEPLGTGETITDCALISTAPQTLHAFKAGAGGRILNSTYDASGWTPWEQTGMHLVLPTQYVFSVDLVKVDTARSLNADTDTAQSTLTIGNSPAATATQSNSALGGTHPKQWQTNLLQFGPVSVELADSVVFNYQIVNKGNPNPNVVDKALNDAGKKLADYAVKSVSKSLLSGLQQIESVEIGSLTSAVPVIGPMLGIVGSWLLSELTSIVFADCDGLVAVEQVVLLGRDLYVKTGVGSYRVTTTHPGTDSATGCGANSLYEVSWSITRT